jgi:cytochrome c peroxidase
MVAVLDGEIDYRFSTRGLSTMVKTRVPVCLVCLIVFLSLACTSTASDLGYLLENKELQRLGELLFFDKTLSTPPGQSCADCHALQTGWTGPDEEINGAGAVYAGAMSGRFANRKPPTSAYSTLAPPLHIEEEDGERLFVGGVFWDGRATGWDLGNPAADQAHGPLLNPLEQNNPNVKAVISKICKSSCAGLFQQVCTDIWGIGKIDDTNLDMAKGIISLAIAAFENSDRMNQFTSKYDYYLKGMVDLTPQEKWGLALFEDKGKCAECHPSKPGPKGEPPLFTDFTYDNLGLPKNSVNPWYSMPPSYNPDGPNWVDPGLGGFLAQVPQYAMFASDNLGKHKVPTVRNVDKRPDSGFIKAYGHNGYFKTLEGIVHFYNKRDVLPLCPDKSDPQLGVNCWPEPEVLKNINKDELGDLKLTLEEELAIVEFMRTLSDGYELP